MPELRRSAEPRSVILHGQALRYILKRSSARRTMALQVGSGGLSVSAPWRLPVTEIERFIAQKQDWIHGKLAQLQGRTVEGLDWCDGMTLPYLGRSVGLNVVAEPSQTVLTADRLQLPVRSSMALQKAVLGWYQRTALSYFEARMKVFLPLLKRPPAQLLLTNARTRWGSCTRQGVVRLNWRLLQAEPAQIDYVLAHELAHLEHLDHSPAFWRAVARLYPDFVAARQALRENGHRYHVLSGS
jgi:predicted metal-dependent hydrolase